jgi:hypothetical protein
MKELESVLDKLVAEAPVEKANWIDVLARAGRRRRRFLDNRKPLVVGIVAAAFLGLAGTAVAIGIDWIGQQDRFHAGSTDDPQRIGPLVEIASGANWSLVAWQSEVGVCIDFVISANSPFSCGFPVRGAKSATDASGAGLPTHAVAGFVSSGTLVGSDGKTTIFGVAAREVEAVKVELTDGRGIDAAFYRAPPELGADIGLFMLRLPLAAQKIRSEGPVRAYAAYGGDGRLIERVSG